MNRRRFLGGLAAALPVLAGAGWWWGRERRGPGGEHVSPASAAGPDSTARTSLAPPPTQAAPASVSRPQSRALRYGAGLPLRLARPQDVGADCAAALDVARRHILAHCTDMGWPNLAIHGMRALGRELPLGGDTFRVLLQSFSRETVIAGRVLLEVPVRDEGHGHAMLKSLIERQCELELEFAHDGRTYRFHDVLDSARELAVYPTQGPVDDHSWLLMALARVTPRAEARWLNVHGQSLDLERLLDDTSAALHVDTQLVRDVDLEQAELPRDCAVFRRICGGLHMLYALAAALSSGYATPARQAAFAGHMRTLVRRCRYDLRVIEQVEALNAARSGPERAHVNAVDQSVKFLGHSLEIVGLVDQFELYRFTPEERRAVDAARERLCHEITGTANLDLGRYQSSAELYESLVSGLCHAYNGLLLSPG